MLLGRKWTIVDYGDAIPSSRGGPINDAFGEVVTERNQFLATHLEAGKINNQIDTQAPPTYIHVMSASREVRWKQYQHAVERNKRIGLSMDNDPLVPADLRAHALDALYPNHDRGRRSLICFVPDVLLNNNACVLRVSPSCRSRPM